MPTDTAPSWTRERSFALRAVGWSLGLFGLLRLSSVETHALLPLTRLQGQLGAWLFGTSALPIEVTLACSGADALALCLGAIAAYPVSWRTRGAGAGGALVLILGLNTLRIGSLGRVAGSPAWFEALHVYVWPAALLFAIAGYVFAWMRFADSRETGDGIRKTTSIPFLPDPPLTRRFVGLTAVFLLLFVAASPLYLESAYVLAVASFIARAAAAALQLFGIDARAAANVLWTPRGGFLVTQECISTPLIPLYLAAVVAYSRTWRGRAIGLLATVPLFAGLGIARLLVVAVPAVLIASPVFLIHAFYQLLLAAVVVFIAACWRHGARGTAARHALAGIGLAVASVMLLGGPYAHVVTAAADMLRAAMSSSVGRALADPQGAMALLPGYQLGLYIGLWVAACMGLGWTRFAGGLALLGLTQMTGLAALQVLSGYSGFAPHVRDLRAWAIVAPLVIVGAMVNYGWSRR